MSTTSYLYFPFTNIRAGFCDNYVPQWWVEFKDELSSRTSWVGCLLKDSVLFVLFAENSQILLKISVIPILFNFHVSGSTKSVSKQPTQLIVDLNLALWYIIGNLLFTSLNIFFKDVFSKKILLIFCLLSKVAPCI